MTRCSYIPPEGQFVIALAKERGGTTDGDIQALRDRFGCEAEARFEMTGEEDSDREQFSCINHVGHLCGEGYWLVRPVYQPSDAPLTIANTQGIARAGFGAPMILAPPAHGFSASPNDIATVPIAPVVDLGTNPTREQLAAHGFSADGAAYREARAAFVPVIVNEQTVGVVRPELVLSSGNLPLSLHPTSVTPGHDGSSATLRIVAPSHMDQFARLEEWHRARALVRVDAGPEMYAIVKRDFEGGTFCEWTMTLVLKQIRHIVANVEI